MTPQQQKSTINTIAGSMLGIDGPKKEEIINRQLSLWFRVDPCLGAGVAAGLGIQGQHLDRLK
jgi:catalase